MTKDTGKAQVTRFREAAKSFGADESEERFDAALRKIAAHKPPPDGALSKDKPGNKEKPAK